MSDFADFAGRMLAADQAAAEAAGGDAWHNHGQGSGIYRENLPDYPGPIIADPYGYLGDELANHIARHDPARVLREVAARRAILDAWRDNELERGEHASYADGLADGLRLAVAYLAMAWRDQPGYDQSWAPDVTGGARP